VLDPLKTISSQKYIQAVSGVGVYSDLEEKGKASEWLRKAYADRSIGNTFARIKVDAIYDPQRSDARFAEPLLRTNLQT
jgi:hypothetical protein